MPSPLPPTPLHPSAFPHLKVEPDAQDPRLLLVEIDHGRANEMGTALLHEWERLAAGLEAGEHRVLVTWSRRRSERGTPIFIAGADVSERVGWDDERVKAHVRWQRQVLDRLRRAPVFHVVVVDGLALGWGTEFLLTADYRIAGPGAAFALPETGIGILPGAGGTAELAALVGVGQALRLGMTGERIDGHEAQRIGLVEETCDSLEAGLHRARALGELVARRSPTAVAAFKRGVLDALGQPYATRAEIEARAYERCVDNGDAALGRASFKAITQGQAVDWPARRDR